MSARGPRRRVGFGILLGVAVVATLHASSIAHAVTCSPSYSPFPDKVFFLNDQAPTSQFDQEPTNWMAIGVLALANTSDYDIALYPSCSGGQAITGSVLGLGRTDFVIGDFNNNPTGIYAVDLYCYGGACTAAGTYAAAVWRPGDLMFVDFPATTVTFNSGPPYSPDMVLKVWDVFLSAGTTYYFQFSSTLGAGAKMLLFRNPGGGTYWAGRGGAEFEVSGCTAYTAPTTGYYGLVVVNDVWSFGSSTVGVFTTPQCACADQLPPRVPVAVPAAPTTAYKWVNQTWSSWAAIGTRPPAGSDWDLEVSSSGSTPGCSQSVLANSTFGSGTADFVITDFNHVQPSTLAARTYRYAGAGGATMEWDRSANFSDLLQPNGPQIVESWGPSDVLQCWDVFLYPGKEYTFQFFPSSNMRLFLFRNPGNGLYSTGRNGAVMQGSSTFKYTPASAGYYGVVVAKDDELAGNFALRVGVCDTTYAVPAATPFTSLGSNLWYLSIAPAAGRWTAMGARCPTADWDLFQYDSTTPAAWPDCYSPVDAISEASSVPDFIVGDFHHNPPGTYPIRAKQFTSGASQEVALEWAGPATPLVVNAPATIASPDSDEVLRIYEAFLVSGWNYQIAYGQTASRPLLVFGNPSGGAYWAPRNQALLSTATTTTFTAPSTGDYAFVIANDGAQNGSFSLRINTTGSVGVGDDAPRFATRLEGARPNPGRSDLALHYSLAAPARVRFELLDLSGRRMWSVDEGIREAGEWSLPLARGGASEHRIPAGLYFVHFEVDGRLVDVRKVTLLD